MVDLEGQTPAFGYAGEELRVVGQGNCRFEVVHTAVAHVVKAQRDHALRSQDTLTAQLAVIEHHAQKLQVVSHRAVEAATAHFKLGLLRNFKGEHR